jgi:hypothetical protein
VPPIDPRVEELVAIERRFSLSANDVGVLAGVAASTVRFVETSGHMRSCRRPQREAILAFLERARKAQRRSDLHLCEVRP